MIFVVHCVISDWCSPHFTGLDTIIGMCKMAEVTSAGGVELLIMGIPSSEDVALPSGLLRMTDKLLLPRLCLPHKPECVHRPSILHSILRYLLSTYLSSTDVQMYTCIHAHTETWCSLLRVLRDGKEVYQSLHRPESLQFPRALETHHWN